MFVNWIEPELYNKIKELMPIPCVDLLVHQGKSILLLKRVNEPAKGLWFSAGGRILKGELLKEAVHRKAIQELGTDVIIEKQVKTYDFLWRLANGEIAHTPTTYFVVSLYENYIKLDSQHSCFKWVTNVEGLHPFLVRAIEDSGILGDDE